MKYNTFTRTHGKCELDIRIIKISAESRDFIGRHKNFSLKRIDRKVPVGLH